MSHAVPNTLRSVRKKLSKLKFHQKLALRAVRLIPLVSFDLIH
jgi:hypothetical protein